MKILILAAMAEELAALPVASENIITALTGVGKVNTAVETTRLILEEDPDLVVNFGSAAGLQPDIAIGDVVVAKGLSYYDVDVTAFDYAYGQLPKMPQQFQPRGHFSDMATAEGVSIHRGLIVTGDSFVQRKDQIDHITKHFPSALALDMESAAVAHTCYKLAKPCVVIRGISDVVGGEQADTHVANLSLSCERAAKVVGQLLAAANA